MTLLNSEELDRFAGIYTDCTASYGHRWYHKNGGTVLGDLGRFCAAGLIKFRRAERFDGTEYAHIVLTERGRRLGHEIVTWNALEGAWVRL